MVLVVENQLTNVREIRVTSSIPGSGRSPGGGNGNALQYSCLENPRDGGAWWIAVYEVTQSWTLLKRLSSSRSNEVKYSDFYFQKAKTYRIYVHGCLVTSVMSDPMDCSPPGFSVQGILQARILECVAIPSSRGSS